jgi:hypothetical protein
LFSPTPQQPPNVTFYFTITNFFVFFPLNSNSQSFCWFDCLCFIVDVSLKGAYPVKSIKVACKQIKEVETKLIRYRDVYNVIREHMIYSVRL